jgi:hypothetical protein
MKTLFATLLLLAVLSIKAQLPLLQIGDNLPLESVKMKCATTDKDHSILSEKKRTGLL